MIDSDEKPEAEPTEERGWSLDAPLEGITQDNLHEEICFGVPVSEEADSSGINIVKRQRSNISAGHRR